MAGVYRFEIDLLPEKGHAKGLRGDGYDLRF